MFSSTSNNNDKKNKKSRRIHTSKSPPHDGGSLPCKEEEQEQEQEQEDITAAAEIYPTLEQQEYERLLRLAEQSLRERDTKGDAVFLEMERMIMNDIAQEQQEKKKEDRNNNSTKQEAAPATATSSSSTAAMLIKNEDEVLLAADDDNRLTTKRKRRHQSESVEQHIHQLREYKKERHRTSTLSKKHASEGVDLNLNEVDNSAQKKRMTCEERIDQLREYKKQHGTANVSSSIDLRLYKWLNNQKVNLRDGTLRKERALMLEQEGVDIKLEVDNPSQKKKMHTFEERIDQLREYKKQHGTANVSWSTDQRLYKWLNNQKVNLRDGTLSKERALLLEDEGVDLQLSGSSCFSRRATFDERVQQLRHYKAQHGTLNALRSMNEPLYDWLNQQKVKYSSREGNLSKKHASALEEEGLVDPNLKKRMHTFEERVDQLREYKKQHGTVNVSRSIDGQLYRWLNDQKQYLRDGTLRKERALMLEDEGVDPYNKRATFDEWFDRLQDYKAQHGTANVLSSINQPLYNWIYYQKVKHSRVCQRNMLQLSRRKE